MNVNWLDIDFMMMVMMGARGEGYRGEWGDGKNDWGQWEGEENRSSLTLFGIEVVVVSTTGTLLPVSIRHLLALQ